jgi:hypothetical protein
MANVSQVLPAGHPYFRIVPKRHAPVALHTPAFRDLADRPYAYAMAITPATGLAVAAAKLLTGDKTLTALQRAFRS